MKNLKTFESFNNEGIIDVPTVNQLINNEKFINFTNSIPEFIKNKIRNFLKDGYVDLSVFVKLDKKYNLFERIRNLYEKGYRSIKDILDRILPKNEEFDSMHLLIVVGFIFYFVVVWLGGSIGVIAGTGAFTDWYEHRHERGWIFFRILAFIICVLYVTLVGAYGLGRAREYDNQVAKERGEYTITIKGEDAKQDTVTLVRDKDGNYKVEKENW